jgi:hypothetical protein
MRPGELSRKDPGGKSPFSIIFPANYFAHKLLKIVILITIRSHF